ncbi:ribosome silencing factor [Brachybacterium huguangmaarense]|uniref:Ribosomal silencing factor RsfS n=1 Tax=Brachybacterium huguangmaarense TaxID=1652028 RepID=A0ABY6FYV8_9MICO|nr:ribosome silencing factor [Brachybacterium huguangmaarense]UYG16118.1 ribosome silencing factor [Brachybacterium huguangmaarense]
MSAPEESIELARVAGQAAADKLAGDVIALDVSEQLVITDIFLVCSGTSERQVSGIVDGIEEEMLKKLGRKPVRREGEADARWVLLDYNDIVVHVQHAEDRAFYALERLWRDAPVIDLQLDDAAAEDASGTAGASSAS